MRSYPAIMSLFLILLPTALGAQETDPFATTLARHLERGALLDSSTAREFAARGWGERYRDAVAALFRGTPAAGVRLDISLQDGQRPAVGRPLALAFRLTNTADQPVTVTSGGTCQTVHAATFLVIDPAGNLALNVGRGLVGGPHCFCQQATRPLPAGATLPLDHRTDSPALVHWSPARPGRYVIIGEYVLPEPRAEGFRAQSPPLVIDVQAPQEPAAAGGPSPRPEPQPVELSGRLVRPVKWTPQLEIIPSGQVRRFDLRGNLLDGIKEGTPLRVRGVVRSELHRGGTPENPSPTPSQWLIWLEVTHVEILADPLDVLNRPPAR